ncbi:hypothetical protein C5B42_05105 [Candidatus Cerribacteria bacterium 'Amazon FNV 2010 28 9']|uniref:Uncharacterized protein n=1 Tax=Candidatus Cerribacteria bacterium 'Amazon FNV 2010 28 9' TaxID=2081795 RepID=A0A317JQ96_9BACT|nr:MAG: hypothetical protein C5B42_05105 [Candidatus Cerribacteria bacterium 'Amazon FNV 2010 28 9']
MPVSRSYRFVHGVHAIFLAFFLFFACLHFTTPIRADISDTGVGPGELLTTNPKDRNVTVTATVGDFLPPSVPILISPEDQSTITTTLPTFIWQPSTDNVAVDHYQLWLDGSLLFDNIPTASTTNNAYSLVVEDGEMKLTPKTTLSQGPHTWYVVALDTSNLSATSATWHFTISITAPPITITQVGTATVSITSTDSTTVPTDPIQLNDNNPTISGSTNPGTALQLTVNVPGQTPQILTLSANPDGTFAFNLGTLPTDVTILFSIVGSDNVGNTSTITNVPFLIKSAVIIITPPFPSATPIIIPVPRPIEVLPTPAPIIQHIPILQPIVTNPVTQIIASLTPLVSVVAPVVVTTAVAVQAGTSLLSPILELLSRILESLGLIPVKKPRGVVYDTKTGAPVPFARVSIIKVADEQILESVVSDVDGIYSSIQFPKGVYRMTVAHTEYVFPTRLSPRFFVNPHDFYRGEAFEIKKENEEELFIIPLDPILDTVKQTARVYWRIALSFFRRIIYNLFYPLAIFSFGVTIMYPTIWNKAICVLYIVMIVWRIIHLRREPMIIGKTVDKDGKPLPFVSIKCVEEGTNTLSALIRSNEKGEFHSPLPLHRYMLTFTKDGFLLDEKQGSFSTMYVDHTGKEPAIVATMIEVGM